MKHGFKSIVRDLVFADPGHTAEEYARMALKKGLARSDSDDPVFSLQTTLRKEVREGRMPEMIAQKVNGRLHYFPVGTKKREHCHRQRFISSLAFERRLLRCGIECDKLFPVN